MDYQTIDNFKLSRLEILLNQLFNWRLFRFKNGFDVSNLGSITIFLVVVAVILGMGATVLETINAEVSVLSNTSQNTIASDAVGTLADFIPTIAIVAAAAIVIGVVLTIVGGRSSYSDDEDTESDEDNKEQKDAEEENNNDYYKAEPDFDDAKKSFLDKYFRRYKK